MAFHLLLTLVLVCSVWSSAGGTSANDVVALNALLREWRGSSGNAVGLETWSLNENADPCGARWKGVVCSPSKSVVNLRLNNAGLSGGIPTSVGDLEELEILDLSGNTRLASTIPKQIGHLRRLTHLKLSGCNFTGKVPQEIYNLNNLKYLDISSNPHLSVDQDAQPTISLRKQPEPVSSSRRHLRHGRSLLQLSSSSGSRKNLPLFYTYIALGCVGFVFLVVMTFCCCRFISVRRTRHDVFLTTPGAPGHPTSFQPKPSRSIHIANKLSDTEDRL